MKLLDNPWVVGLLGLGALVIVITQTMRPRGSAVPPPATRTPPPSGGVVVNTPPTLPGAPHDPGAAAPTRSIDFDYVRAHIVDWLSPTQRDPFMQARLAPPPATNAAAVKISQLKLRGLWRQDGVGMVAIGNGIYHVGDLVEGYLVQRIENNGVWLENNGHKEMVVFDHSGGPAAPEMPDPADGPRMPPRYRPNN